MKSLAQKVLVLSLGALLLLASLYVLVTREMDSWNDASTQVMRDYKRAMLDGELHAALTRATGETASYVLTGEDRYRAEAAEAIERAEVAVGSLRQVASEPRHITEDDTHLRFLERQERMLGVTRERFARATVAAPRMDAAATAEALSEIYANEEETDALWEEIADHHRTEQVNNVAIVQDHSVRARILFLGGAAAFAFAAILLIGYVRRRVVRPLTLLARLTQSVAAGDPTARAEVTHADEIGQLQHSFNKMVADLEQQRRQVAGLVEGLEVSRDAARRASRAKSDFLANVSHEIRTPMNGVLIGLDLLHETASSPEQREVADMARAGARHLLGMLNDLLDFSRIETGRLKLESVAFEPRKLVTQMVELHGRRAAEKGVAMSCQIAGDVPEKLCGDPTRLGQILLNLLHNAIKFTDRGSIEVSVSLEEPQAGPAAPGAAQPPLWLRFRVTDTGVGITAEAADKIFEPFYQAGGESIHASAGIGLGLGIARELARLMGGALGFESEAGKGSSFWFTARLLPEAECSAATAAEAPPSRLQPGKSILLVEDHRDTREVMTRMLQRRGLRVTTAGSGGDALSLATTGNFDLILMDCRMPEMDGFEATRAIRAAAGDRARVPIVALTAYGLTEPKQHYLDSGFDDLVVKPYTLEDIEAMLQRWLAR